MPLSATIPLWIMNWLWVPQVVLVVTVLPLLFPDGHLPGPRWRPALSLAGVAAVSLLTATIIDAWPTGGWGVANPPRVVTASFVVGGLTLLAATLVSLSAMVVRWRRAAEDEREPFRIVGLSAAVMALTAIATYPWQNVWIPATLSSLYQLFAAYALAVARFRLHDVEPVLGKDMLSRALSLVVAGAYLAVVVAIGSGRTEHRVVPVAGVALAAVLVLPGLLSRPPTACSKMSPAYCCAARAHSGSRSGSTATTNQWPLARCGRGRPLGLPRSSMPATRSAGSTSTPTPWGTCRRTRLS